MKITNEGWAVIERDTHLGLWVIEHKRIDFDQNALPQMLPYIKETDIVYDIGANIGCYAYAFAKKGKFAVCFEPNNEVYECLKHNMSGVNHAAYRMVISDSTLMYDVVQENDNIGMAYVKENEQGEEASMYLDMALDVLSLPAPDFIKIDVEGYELHVLRGAEKTIGIHKPVMVIEINDHTLKRTGVDRKEIFEWLLSHGYSFRNIYQEQGLTDDQLDIICFPT